MGKVGALNVDEARAKAREWHELLLKGVDPALEAERLRSAALRSQQHTFAAVAEAYFAHTRREGLKKAAGIEREIRKEFVSVSAPQPIADIGPDDLRSIIATIVDRGAASPGSYII